MWYATQVCTGREEKVIQYCHSILNSETLKDCFTPKYEVKKKYQGTWHTLQEVMFPGYIFVVSDEVNQLFRELKKIPELVKLLGMGEEPVPLQAHEVAFLEKFSGEKRVVEMSEGYIEGDRVVITEGPMIGYEGFIKKVDRHKRLAVIEVEFFGRKMEAKVGVEIVRRE